ncbi:MAG: DUF2127 domain-containing protein [Chloroflexi bacterium]|nr:DUF2127 domain-containing protein [Chloroflexota bacterium]
MGASATPSRRPLGVTIFLAVLALGAIVTLPVAFCLFVGLIDAAFIGLGPTGLSGPALALGLFAYSALALVLAYGVWTLRRWGWWFGLIFLAGSLVSDVVGGIVGWQPPLISAAFIAAGLLVLAYWLRLSVRAAFRS